MVSRSNNAMEPRLNPTRVSADIRRVLVSDGSPDRGIGVQGFFREEIKSHGWYTSDLRRLAGGYRKMILKELGLDFLVRVADQLFTGRAVEEKIVAVFLLEKLSGELEDSHFALFETWLDRLSSWADHDGLVHYLIAPMVSAKPARANKVFVWAKSRDRWHRRAACVALIHGTRRKKFFSQIKRLSGLLLADEDDMVQKGLGWLLRETAKVDAKSTIPYLIEIQNRAPRLVLRTACETLTARDKARVLRKRVQ